QLLPDLEERDALRMHRDEGAGLRVAPLARLAMLHHEAAESPDLDALAAHEGLGEALEHLVDDDLGVATREARKELHHLVDEIALRHGGLSPRMGRPASRDHRSAPRRSALALVASLEVLGHDVGERELPALALTPHVGVDLVPLLAPPQRLDRERDPLL